MTGCQLAGNAVKNVNYEFELATAEILERCNYEKLAQASWQTLRPPQTVPKEYAQGFKDGFVDYLQFGGSGQPPYVPPKRFWGPHYRTPEGYQANENWFAGFHLGTAMAQQSGYRKWVTLPSAPPTALPPPVLPPAPVQPVPVPVVAPVAETKEDPDMPAFPIKVVLPGAKTRQDLEMSVFPALISAPIPEPDLPSLEAILGPPNVPGRILED